MQFFSIAFFVLFAICFILYIQVGKRYRNILLLAASFVFIGWSYLPFLITALAIALFTYFWAIHLQKHPSKATYGGGIFILISSWVLFHYTGIAGEFVHLLIPSLSKESVMRSLIFPIGMSFYTFQAIGYMTDVYWGEEKSERNLVDFLLYMLFFMKFLSGPIERPGALIHQLKEPVPFDYSNAVTGLKFILLGLMKKLLIANHLAPHTAIMFDSVNEISGLQMLMTCLIYPVELYTDFSGYTDIAIGGARMFGIELSPNFNRPFVSTSTSDLWRRWHMSLSFWVRDYLFMPISMSLRKWKQWGIYVSLAVTFLLLGLWHGLGLSFAIYGLIQGVIICLEMKFGFVRTWLYKHLGHGMSDTLFIARTYLLFALSLIFFKLPSVKDAFYFISHISFKADESWKEMNIGIPDHNCIVAGSSFFLLLVFEYFNSKTNLMQKLGQQPAWIRWTVYYLLVIALFSLAKFDNEDFIYLQF